MLAGDHWPDGPREQAQHELYMPPKKFALHLRAGFSLVEVVIALGVVSFAFFTLVCLMPVGLKTMHDAMDTTTEGMIVQQIASEARLGSFTNLEADYNNQTFYCDDDGSNLTNTSSATSVFKIAATVTSPAYPGSAVTTVSAISNNIQMLRLAVCVVPGGAGAATRTNYYNVLIPYSGD